MAIIQGMCKNCGSLIVFDERDSQCECVFCHCVFPSEQAVEIFKNPEGVTFPNEKYEQVEGATKHNATRVFSTESLEKQIAREELRKANSEERPNNEFEVQAKDVKAPMKLTIGLIVGAVVIAAAIFFGTYPMYKSRISLRADIEADISRVFAGVTTVDTTTEVSGDYYDGFSVFGQTCQYINAVTDEELTEEDARIIFDNYCALRAEKIAGGVDDSYDGVVLNMYCAGGHYHVTGANGSVNIEFTDDAGSTEG